MSATATGADVRVIAGVGKLEFRETPTRRDYWLTPEGKDKRYRVPSVTTILNDVFAKPFLVDWAAKLGKEAADAKRDASAVRGKALHAFVEVAMAEGRLTAFDDFAPDVRPFVTGAARFLFDHDPRMEAVETLVVHPEMHYAGRLDLRATIDGKSTLLDFKTSETGTVYPEAHLQTCAYAMADERCGAPPVDQIWIVGLAEDGSYRVRESHPTSPAVWQAAVDFFHAKRALESATKKAP